MESGMLTQEEGDAVLAIVHLLNLATLKPLWKTICLTDNCWCSLHWSPRGVNFTCYEVKSDMGASVGVGGLIIGISMLVVFSMAYQAISLQVDSGVDRIEDAANEPAPTFTIDDAIIYSGAIVNVTITSGGQDTAAVEQSRASGGSGGFSATIQSTGMEHYVRGHHQPRQLFFDSNPGCERWWNTNSVGEPQQSAKVWYMQT